MQDNPTRGQCFGLSAFEFILPDSGQREKRDASHSENCQTLGAMPAKGARLETRPMAFYLSPSEAAAVSGISERTLKALRHKGKLIEGIHWERLGYRSIMFISSNFSDWLNQRKN